MWACNAAPLFTESVKFCSLLSRMQVNYKSWKHLLFQCCRHQVLGHSNSFGGKMEGCWGMVLCSFSRALSPPVVNTFCILMILRITDSETFIAWQSKLTSPSYTPHVNIWGKNKPQGTHKIADCKRHGLVCLKDYLQESSPATGKKMCPPSNGVRQSQRITPNTVWDDRLILCRPTSAESVVDLFIVSVGGASTLPAICY